MEQELAAHWLAHGPLHRLDESQYRLKTTRLALSIDVQDEAVRRVGSQVPPGDLGGCKLGVISIVVGAKAAGAAWRLVRLSFV